MTSVTPQFLILTDAECRALLDRNHVGRLAFLNRNRVDIQPISYVARGPWLFLRSAYGTKLEAISRAPYVAFEVDEIAGPFDWRSVVVHGTVYDLPPLGASVAWREHQEAVEALRMLNAQAFTPQDPVAERDIVYGLRIDTMSGRVARPDDEDTYLRPAVPAVARPERRPGDGT